MRRALAMKSKPRAWGCLALQIPAKIAIPAPTMLAIIETAMAIARNSDGAMWLMKRIIPPIWNPHHADQRGWI